MFADDTNLFVSNKNIGKLFQQMNKELKSVSTWFKTNKLSINIIKTKCTIFHANSKKRFMPAKFPELFTDGITLKRETVTKFLDVFIDENVTWKARVNSISTDLIPRKQSNQLYFPFVHSYLNYANLAWGSTQKTKSVLFIVNTLAPWCSGYHHCTTSFNNV